MSMAWNKKLEKDHRGIILWLSGWSMTDMVFERLCILLPEYNHISVDLSEADSVEGMLLLTEMAAENALCVAREGGVPLLVAGWSLGGLLALRLAAKGYADSLVLFAATARFTRSKEEAERGWPDPYVRGMITGITQDRQAVETKFRKLIFTDVEWEVDLHKKLPPVGSWTSSALIAGLQILRSEEYLTELPNIRCPVLIVHGAEDKICPYGAALELQEQLPDARLYSIPACGHIPFLGRENFIADEWRRWWNEGQNGPSWAPI
ncbi:alpha/beta hydrolase [Paenibacillus herberti]|nr:alpha/beta hydrolase [Paenibacillus herberti]